MTRDLVSTYAMAHLMAAHTGVAMFRAASSRHEGSPWGAELGALTADVEADRASLEQIVRTTGRHPGSVPQRAARYALEGVGHVSRVLHWPTELASLAELEKLRGGVSAKAVGFGRSSWLRPGTTIAFPASTSRNSWSELTTSPTGSTPSTCRWRKFFSTARDHHGGRSGDASVGAGARQYHPVKRSGFRREG